MKSDVSPAKLVCALQVIGTALSAQCIAENSAGRAITVSCSAFAFEL